MRILVLGAGAVGGYFGGRLAEAGLDVTFLVRARRAGQLAENGLVIRSGSGDACLRVQTLQAGESFPQFDVVLLTAKAYDLDAAVESIRPAMGPDTCVVPLLNGLAHIDRLVERFGADRVLGGYCQVGATLSDAGEILHLNRYHLLAFGELDGRMTARVERLAAAAPGAKLQLRPTESIIREMWQKLVFLGTLAGMTCLMRASVGDIAATREGSRLMLQLLAELAAVATAAGEPPSSGFLERIRGQLTEAGSTFTASMLRDLERGGPTEGDHILGDLVRRSEALGVAAPLLRIAATNLAAYEIRRSREAAAPEVS